MRTFKVCPPAGLWTGLSDDGGNDTYFTTNVENVTTLNRWCLSLDYDYPGSHLYWLDTIGYPILLGFCTFGNLLSLLVFCCERPNSSKNVYLGAIAIANFIYMWSQLPFYLHNNFANVRYSESFTIFFWRSEAIWKFLIDAFVTFSDWLLLVFCFERLISLCAPGSYANRSDTGVGKAFLGVSLAFLGAVFYSLYNLIGYYWFYYHFHYGNTDTLPYSLQVWRHMQQLAILCIPIGTYGLILVVSLHLILFVLIRRKRYPAPLSASKESVAGDLTRIAIASFVLYFLCLVPMLDLDVLSLLNAYHLYDMPLTSRMYQIWYPIALYILNVNYSINVFIYLLVSPSFRRTLGRILCCRGRHEGSLTGRPILAYPERSSSPGSGVFLRNGLVHPNADGIKL